MKKYEKNLKKIWNGQEINTRKIEISVYTQREPELDKKTVMTLRHNGCTRISYNL